MATKKTTKKKAAKPAEVTIETASKKSICCTPKVKDCGSGSCFYFLGGLGAAIYYLALATGFWSGVLGILKSIVWPVFLVHGLLKFIGA